jgi:hypothetical protein
MIIKTRKMDPRAEGGARILIKESDRDVSSLEKSSTDMMMPCKSLILLLLHELFNVRHLRITQNVYIIRVKYVRLYR